MSLLNTRKFYLNGHYPVVFIISDNTKGESEENRLFPKDLQASLRITNIRYGFKLLNFIF